MFDLKIREELILIVNISFTKDIELTSFML